MNKKELIRIMDAQTEIALATSINNIPNVRIVNFIFDSTNNILYFTTFGDNDKVTEFNQNKEVAFTTIPHNRIEHIKGKGWVEKSKLSLNDISEQFTDKISGYKETLAQAGEYLILYEIKLYIATITLDFENIEVVKFDD